MATETIYIEAQVREEAIERNLTLMEKLMLRRFHPRSVLLNVVGLTWFTYLFWRHEWVAAIAVVLACRALAVAFAPLADYSNFAKTVWGKIALLHLHPANLAIQLAGCVPLFVGLWRHETPWILGGLTIVVLGHWFGWSKVHTSFAR